MDTKVFEDKRATDLLSRVRDDISSLRLDVKHLVRHAGTHTLPVGARELARSGRAYAKGGIQRAGRTVREHPAGVSLGGVLLFGAVAAGAYLLLRGGCCQDGTDFEEEVDELM